MNARELAVLILSDIYEQGAYANIALAKYLNKYPLDDVNRRFLTELVYGTVKAGDTLLWILKNFVKKPLSKLDTKVLTILRLGCYQLVFMDKIPASAACNESVKLAKKYTNPGAAKFVNGVLRSITREPAKTILPTGNKAGEIAIREQHPLWLVKKFIHTFGSEATRALCEFDNTNAPLVFRTNTLKLTPDELLNMLTQEGCIVKASQFAPEGLICTEHSALNNLPALQQGYAQVQDESSMLVAHVLAPQPGEFIIDTCSAPGGKTTHLAAKMNNQGRIIAGDIHEHKLSLIAENAKRLGIDIVEPQLIDATTIGDKFPGQADRVLVDAPCSGLGVLRRKPDARWNKTESILQELPSLQAAILQSASKTVKPGGILVYSTCTIVPEENEDVVKAFLANNPDFELEPINKYLPYKRKQQTPMLQLLPYRDNTDGFFIARMRRKNATV